MNQEQLLTIQKIADKLASKYTFGIYDEDDIKQEIFLIAASALDKFDEAKASLENFLFVHVNNRLKTLIRDNHFTNGKNWIEDRKKNIINTVDIDKIDENSEKGCHFNLNEAAELDKKTIFELIDKHLQSHLRADYLRLLHGNSIPTARKEKVITAISSILKDNGYAKENW
jgi:DNA-directed RNA polymerase specialized sigma24 family protein